MCVRVCLPTAMLSGIPTPTPLTNWQMYRSHFQEGRALSPGVHFGAGLHVLGGRLLPPPLLTLGLRLCLQASALGGHRMHFRMVMTWNWGGAGQRVWERNCGLAEPKSTLSCGLTKKNWLVAPQAVDIAPLFITTPMDLNDWRGSLKVVIGQTNVALTGGLSTTYGCK